MTSALVAATGEMIIVRMVLGVINRFVFVRDLEQLSYNLVKSNLNTLLNYKMTLKWLLISLRQSTKLSIV